MKVTRDGNVASERVGYLRLVVAGTRAITDETWREHLGHSAADAVSHQPAHGVLFWSPTQGPSARQRKMLTEEFANAIGTSAERRVAVLTDSAMVRGTVTAIHWFTRKKFIAFSPKEVDRALDWLAEDVAFDRAKARRALEQAIDVVRKPALKNGTS
jgi:hypothetical protein